MDRFWGKRCGWAMATLALVAGGSACSHVIGADEPRRMNLADGGGSDAAVIGEVPPCGEEQVRCDGACVAVQSDPHHCGACGHTCLGGACEGGVCREVLLARGLTTVFDLAPTSDGLYFLASSISKEYFLERARWGAPPCDGADARCIVSEARAFDTEDVRPRATVLAVRGRSVFLGYPLGGIQELTPDGDGIFARTPDLFVTKILPLAQGDLVLAASGPAPAAVVARGETPRILARVTNGGLAVRDAVLTPEGDALLGVVDQDGLASAYSGFARVPLAGPPCVDNACILLAAQGRAIATAAGWVFLAARAGPPGLTDVQRVRSDGRCEAQGCPDVRLRGEHVASGRAFLADALHLYWVVTDGEGNLAEVRRARHDTVCEAQEGAPCGERFFGPAPFPLTLAQDAVSVFVVEGKDERQVFRKAK